MGPWVLIKARRYKRDDPGLRQARPRLLMGKVVVIEDEIRTRGSKAIRARAASGDPDVLAPAILYIVWEWRAHGKWAQSKKSND